MCTRKHVHGHAEGEPPLFAHKAGCSMRISTVELSVRVDGITQSIKPVRVSAGLATVYHGRIPDAAGRVHLDGRIGIKVHSPAGFADEGSQVPRVRRPAIIDSGWKVDRRHRAPSRAP